MFTSWFVISLKQYFLNLDAVMRNWQTLMFEKTFVWFATGIFSALYRALVSWRRYPWLTPSFNTIKMLQFGWHFHNKNVGIIKLLWWKKVSKIMTWLPRNSSSSKVLKAKKATKSKNLHHFMNLVCLFLKCIKFVSKTTRKPPLHSTIT